MENGAMRVFDFLAPAVHESLLPGPPVYRLDEIVRDIDSSDPGCSEAIGFHTVDT